MTAKESIEKQIEDRFGDDLFAQRLLAFLLGCQEVIDKAELYADSRLVIRGGSKFLGIDLQEYNRITGEEEGCRRWCFVAAEAGFTRSLGTIEFGDVMKPANYKRPAKGARGNIFDQHNGLRGRSGRLIEWTGPEYMK